MGETVREREEGDRGRGIDGRDSEGERGRRQGRGIDGRDSEGERGRRQGRGIDGRETVRERKRWREQK